MAKPRRYEVSTSGNSLITKARNRIFGVFGGTRSCFGRVGLGVESVWVVVVFEFCLTRQVKPTMPENSFLSQ